MWNVSNARALRALRLPLLQAFVCSGLGLPVAAVRWWWDPRKRPRLARRQAVALVPVAALHAAGGVASQAAVLHGPLGLAQTLLALEPAFALTLHSLAARRAHHPIVYASLAPVLAGAAKASLCCGVSGMMQVAAAGVANLCLAARSIAVLPALAPHLTCCLLA